MDTPHILPHAELSPHPCRALQETDGSHALGMLRSAEPRAPPVGTSGTWLSLQGTPPLHLGSLSPWSVLGLPKARRLRRRFLPPLPWTEHGERFPRTGPHSPPRAARFPHVLFPWVGRRGSLSSRPVTRRPNSTVSLCRQRLLIYIPLDVHVTEGLSWASPVVREHKNA